MEMPGTARSERMSVGAPFAAYAPAPATARPYQPPRPLSRQPSAQTLGLQAGHTNSQIIEMLEDELRRLEKQLVDERWEKEELMAVIMQHAVEKDQLNASLQAAHVEVEEQRRKCRELDQWSQEGTQRIQELIETVEIQKGMLENRKSDAEALRQENAHLNARVQAMQREMEMAASSAARMGSLSSEPASTVHTQEVFTEQIPYPLRMTSAPQTGMLGPQSLMPGQMIQRSSPSQAIQRAPSPPSRGLIPRAGMDPASLSRVRSHPGEFGLGGISINR